MKAELLKVVAAHSESTAEKSKREVEAAKLLRGKEDAERQIVQLKEQLRSSSEHAQMLEQVQQALAECKGQVTCACHYECVCIYIYIYVCVCVCVCVFSVCW